MKNKYLEKMIFELEKDNYITGIKDFYNILVKKYQINNYWFYREVYVKIINYQIKTYGTTLFYEYDQEYKTKEDYKRYARNVYKARRQRRGLK